MFKSLKEKIENRILANKAACTKAAADVEHKDLVVSVTTETMNTSVPPTVPLHYRKEKLPSLPKLPTIAVGQTVVAPKEEVKLLDPHVPKKVVVFNSVTKTFGDKIAIENVTFDVVDVENKGELISIVGPSGCGKSTILRIIAGLEPQFPHTSGEVKIFGQDIDGPSRKRGVVDQKYSLLPHLNVVDNIAFGLKIGGMKRKERRDRAREWAKKVGLEGAEEKYPNELSGGMQQRVSLAATLILEPEIILMDEPFGALDPKTRLKMQELLVQLWKENQSTVFLVTHSMEEAVYLGDRVFRMEANPGRLVEILEAPRPDIPPEEMRKYPWFTEMVAELLDRVENSAGEKGELKSIQKLRDAADAKSALTDMGEIDLLKLIS